MELKIVRSFISFYVICVIIKTFIPMPVNAQKDTSKLEMLQFLLDAKDKFNIIKKIRDKPLLQLIGLVNDVVEPIVTILEIISILEQKMNKFENQHKEKDNVLVFSGKNKIEINHFKKPHHLVPFHHQPANLHLQSVSHFNEYESLRTNLEPLGTNRLIQGDAVGEASELFSASVLQKHGYPEENVFKLNFKSDQPQQNFHLSRDLPHNFVLLFGKNNKKGSFHDLNNRTPFH